MPTYEYDLIVIGNTPAARSAALLAAQQSIRVALITQGAPRHDALLQSQSAQHQTQTTRTYDPEHTSLLTAQDLLSPYTLAVAGIDEVTDAGTWHNPPAWIWRTDRVNYQAKRYLLALGQQSSVPPLAQNLDPVVTLESLLEQPWQDLPQRLAIVGASPITLVTAQSLRRTGREITLVARDRLLPQEDPMVVQYLQGILEAAGIRLYTHMSVSQIQQRESQQWLQAGDRALESDRLIWAQPTPRIWPRLRDLGAAGQYQVNRQLRVTPYRNLYACGGWLGGYADLAVGQYEAAIAVHNCLHRRQRSVDYRTVPWVLPTDPPLARVGLTPDQARHRYGAVVQVQTTPRHQLLSARLTETTVGLCRWVTGERGQILGATLLGSGADVAVGALALAIQQGLTIDQVGRSVWG
ncbi:MAG: FAD-dependent oxidoreductase [Cyanobacteria bacterium P01_G01_bin.54]